MSSQQPAPSRGPKNKEKGETDPSEMVDANGSSSSSSSDDSDGDSDDDLGYEANNDATDGADGADSDEDEILAVDLVEEPDQDEGDEKGEPERQRDRAKRLAKRTFRAYFKVNRKVLDALLAAEERTRETVDSSHVADLVPVLIENHALLHVAETVNPGLGFAAEGGAEAGRSAGAALDALDAHQAYRDLKKDRHARASALAGTGVASPAQQAAANSRVAGQMHSTTTPTTEDYLGSHAHIARTLEHAAKEKRNDDLANVPLVVPKTRQLYQLHSFIFNHEGHRRKREELRVEIETLLSHAITVEDGNVQASALALIEEAAPWAVKTVLKLRQLTSELGVNRESLKIKPIRERLVEDLLNTFLSYKYKP